MYGLNRSDGNLRNLLNTSRYLDTVQRSEDEFAALKDHIKAAKDAKKKVDMFALESVVLKQIRLSITVCLADDGPSPAPFTFQVCY